MKSKLIYVALLIFTLLSAFIILNFNGTGGTGDSINHYLFAKSSPVHPELYFNHWAKPLFTLLSSPFAQFGFTGIKIFNATASLFTIFFTFKAAEKMELKNAILTSVILMATPLFLLLTYSGLTEPLFALFIAAGIFYASNKQYLIASIIISFLPFVRSEGLIIMGVFGLYFLLQKQHKVLPLLLVGHVVYSFAGYFVYKDLLWVFTKIPYAAMNDNYGSGGIHHFVVQLMFVLGVPIYILFWIGLLSLGWNAARKKTQLTTSVLVGLGFLAFFASHSLFWYFGKFNSMGLKRVFVGVVPLMVIIALIGFNFITEELLKNKRKPKLIIQGILVGYVLIFPFTSNPAAPKWSQRLNIAKSQECAVKIADYFDTHQEEYPYDKTRFIFIDPYLSLALNIDHFDSSVRTELNTGALINLNSGEIVIWENWFAVVERGITKKMLDEDPRLTFMFDSNVWDNRDIEYGVYKVK